MVDKAGEGSGKDRQCSLFVLLSSETSRNIIMATCDDEPDAYLTKPINSKTLEWHVYFVHKAKFTKLAKLAEKLG